jgi:hypothetical protein
LPLHGAWNPFAAYPAELTPGATPPVVRFLARATVFAEVFLALALLLCWRLRATSLASAALCATFALATTLTRGVEASLDTSVVAFVAASLLLARHPATGGPAPRCDTPDAQPRATLVQLHTPVLEASLPRWRCLAPLGASVLAALVALALSPSP